LKITELQIREIIKKVISEKRDYKDEYKKFQSSTKSKKYRAELNAYNRKKGTYGNGDGLDASHKNGKIVGFEEQSKNRGRAEKSRLKKEGKLDELGGFSIDGSTDFNDTYIAPKRDTSKGDMKTFYQKFSSPEAKKVVDGKLADYVKGLRKLEGKLVKDWMTAAKSGNIDFFDLMRGFNTGDVQRAHKFEIDFLTGVLQRDKIQDRFRSYFKGKKGKHRGK